MDPVTLAETFHAYLRGSLAFDRPADDTERHKDGPFRKQEGSDLHWQLDTTNNFWLHIDPSLQTAQLHTRYGDGWDGRAVHIMAALFEARYVRPSLG